ncbi:MAG: rRNA pseudouridine synthase [Oscillibacter sp.]|nr:rRNA pseudouridine synthase [Oscillibacter sp.]
MAKQRLDKILASTGKWSRREAGELARHGQIVVDGVLVRSADEKADPDTAKIIVKGERLEYQAFIWVMLNKPAGYLSATEDGRDATVLDLLPEELQRRNLFPVGRLDKDTEGLLLLTNEGILAHALLSPRRHVDKVYYTRVAGRLDAVDCAAFAEGMSLADGLQCQPAGLEILKAGEESEALVTLREGKFHQIKRMLAARGKPVLYLERIQMAGLELDRTLSRGSFRFLTGKEVENLRKLV